MGLGACCAAVSVALAAALGAYQERTFKRYGGEWREALFYSHVMALPAFALWRGELSAVMRRWLSPAALSERLELPLPLSVHASLLSLGWHKRPMSVALADAVRVRARTRVPLLPRRWALLMLNLTSAHLAMCGIYKVTTDSSAITCTMAVTARKLCMLTSVQESRSIHVPRTTYHVPLTRLPG